MAKKSHSKLSEWQKRASEGGECERCERTVSVLTVDHIVPLSLIVQLDDTGDMQYEFEENFQLLCHPCNKFKACRLDKSNPKTLPILRKLLAQ